MTKTKLIIDCDPGIDDSLALLYALKSPDLDIVAITITPGNVPTAIGTENALYMLERFNRLDIPVYAGSENPLKHPLASAQETHGEDGFGNTHFQRLADKSVEPLSASQFLADYYSSPKDTHLVTLGPLTNLAEAFLKNPDIVKHCPRLVSMGGAFLCSGNVSPVAEYNYHCDADAAQLVFDKWGHPVEMVGLDVTRQIVLTPNHLAYMKRMNPEIADFIQQITAAHFDFYWKHEHRIGSVVNDPLALLQVLFPNICSGFSAYTDIVTEGIAIGQSIVDRDDFYHKKANVLIYTEVDAFQFWLHFLAVTLDLPTNTLAADLERFKLY
ncbi:nucleoside hydrolase [Streptococcus ictaluri]|uniref:Inosine-uridine preferring nucleoside hydrolase n=1 Tax=Streptococcus ictaluri 707-05 TaxID=764299 RepID=G5K0C4_9STRE|nr:nucleoside hydrolase [Streptococcus ictaluri]EHI70582.1 inosine-uridine preferring nucleoside hydrolase [Streptococcus ictaluri 707-05]